MNQVELVLASHSAAAAGSQSAAGGLSEAAVQSQLPRRCSAVKQWCHWYDGAVTPFHCRLSFGCELQQGVLYFKSVSIMVHPGCSHQSSQKKLVSQVDSTAITMLLTLTNHAVLDAPTDSQQPQSETS